MVIIPPQSGIQNLLGLLSQRGPLMSREAAVIASTLIRNPEELLAVLWNFPGLSKIGVDFPKLSNAAAVASASVQLFQAAAQKAGFFTAVPPSFGQGALHPPGAAAPLGYEIPLPLL